MYFDFNEPTAAFVRAYFGPPCAAADRVPLVRWRRAAAQWERMLVFARECPARRDMRLFLRVTAIT